MVDERGDGRHDAREHGVARLLARLSRALVLESRPEIVVRAALDALVSEVGATSAAVYFTDFDQLVARPAYTVNYPPDVLERVRDISLDIPSMSTLALLTSDVVTIGSRAEAPPEIAFSLELADRMGIHASAAVPLVAAGRTLGVLVYNLGEEHAFSPDETRLLREVGDRIATAVERARMEEELTRHAREMTLLHSIAVAVAGETDLDMILRETLSRLATVLDFTGGLIALVEGDDLVVRAAHNPLVSDSHGNRRPRGVGLGWLVVERGEPILSNDVASDPRRGHFPSSRKLPGSYLAIPLVWHGKPFGLLQLVAEAAGAFRHTDLLLLQTVGTIISGPIELATRYRFEIELRDALDQIRSRLEAILEHAPMGVLFFDREDRLAFANSPLSDALHLLPKGELRLGRSWTELASQLEHRRWGGEPDRFLQLINTTRLTRNEVLVDDLQLRAPDQTLRRIAAPVFESGEFSGHLIILLDVTAEREALRQAEQALALRDRFISIASHELKTPLTAIKGTAQLLLKLHAAGRLDLDRAARSLDTIDTQAARIDRLVDDLLDVSRMQTSRIALRPELIDLAALVSGVARTLPEASRDRILLDLPPELPGQWDPLRLEQVVLNLLDNALKYSPPDRPVDVRLARDGDAAVLTVADYGVGIPAADLPALFRPFSRGANVASSDAPGRGLGLFIARQIVEAHHGDITATSAVDEGATFTVRLPVDGPHPPAPSPNAGRGGDEGSGGRAGLS